LKTDRKITAFLCDAATEVVELRRWFHQHPEIAYKENQTGEYIVGFLKKNGLVNISRAAGTGVVCEIGNGPKTAACRLNMDALPIPERNDSAFKSVYPGYSHACGHDFELAWGLMIAKYFAMHPPEMKLRLLFQPAEEEPGDDPKGRTGGQFFADLGLFNVDAIFSMHVDPDTESGVFNITDGEVTCAAFDFEFIVEGKSCHAAKPHLGINPVLFVAEIVNELFGLQEKLRANIKDEEGFIVITPSVLHTGMDMETMINDESQNTLPAYALVKGISRVRSNLVMRGLLDGLEEIAMRHQQATTVALKLVKRAPATNNAKHLTDIVADAARLNGLSVASKRTTWRDDAGWGAECAPTAHGFLGIGGDKTSFLHSPYFNPDENALIKGLGVYLDVLNDFLNHSILDK
jgi:amidohydrolase